MLSEKDIQNIAWLARIKIESVEEMGTHLRSIIDWIDQLGAVEVEGKLTDPEIISMPERDDKAASLNSVGDILANAPLSHHNMFTVPKVIE